MTDDSYPRPYNSRSGSTEPQTRTTFARNRLVFLLLLFFLSGVAALVYEVLWLKELGRLFGVTAHATSTTLAVFFLGLAAGTLVLGKASARWSNPLRVYALLELAIAATALLYFLLFGTYTAILGTLHETVGYHPQVWLAIRFILAVGILFPPAFFMGGTLPVMAHFLVRRREDLGHRTSLLYAVNTLGAAVGALLAGFYLPRWLGFRGSYLVAIALNVLIAAITFAWSRRRDEVITEGAERVMEPAWPTPLKSSPMPRRLLVLAACSGFLTLALEVLWTRMFAQVLQNSVYTFTAVLTVFLASLAAGSTLARRLCRSGWDCNGILFTLLVISGLLVGFTPDFFVAMNSGLARLSPDLGWNQYILSVFGWTFLILGPPTLLMGSIFPFLMRLAENHSDAAGPTIGRLASVNTLAAIAGSLAAGFALLPLAGLWPSIRFLGAAYLAMALGVVSSSWKQRTVLRSTLVGAIVLLAALLPQRELARAWIDPAQGEELIAITEGVHGTLAVVRRGEDLRMKVNNSYLLGTSESAINSRLMSHLPLALHGEARRVFYLGMGTGITAGGVLDFPVDEVVICELNSDVIRASRDHFSPYLNGLFIDPRVRILPEDGRNYLAATREQYDMIIGDIFLTYRAGVGSLYTEEHFRTVKSRLQPGGMFVQWVTMFDLSSEEFGIIARTMLEVFDQVSLWRRGFSPRFPIYALIARNDGTPLDPATLQQGMERLVEDGVLPEDVWVAKIPLAAYAGNLRQAAGQFAHLPVSTDDRTPLEYLAPITERNSKGSRVAESLSFAPLVDFCFELLQEAPPEGDPYLMEASSQERDQVVAGANFYAYETYRRTQQPELARRHFAAYQEAIQSSVQQQE